MRVKHVVRVVGWSWGAVALYLALTLACAALVAADTGAGEAAAGAEPATGADSASGSSSDGSGGDVPDVPDFSKMRVKQLRALLAERGVECKGCAEKSNFVERVRCGYLPHRHTCTRDILGNVGCVLWGGPARGWRLTLPVWVPCARAPCVSPSPCRETYHLPLKSQQQASAEPAKGADTAAAGGAGSGAGSGAPPGPPPDFDVDAIMEKMRKDQEEKEELLAKLKVRSPAGATAAVCLHVVRSGLVY